MNPTITCAGCGNLVEHDTEAEAWLKTEVLYDPEAVDVGCSGRICRSTGEEHLSFTRLGLKPN